MRWTLCVFDVIVQIAIGLIIHVAVGDPWTWEAVVARIGVTLPLTLICLAAWRSMTGNFGWVVR